MTINLIETVMFLNQHMVLPTNELTIKISEWSNIDPQSREPLETLHNRYWEARDWTNTRPNFAIPADMARPNYFMPSTHISDLLSNVADSFLNGNVNFFREEDSQLLNRVVKVSLDYPLEAFVYMTPFFTYHSLNACQMAILYTTVRWEYRIMASFIKKIRDIEYFRRDIENIEDIEELPTSSLSVSADVNNLIDWKLFGVNNYPEAVQAYHNSNLRMLLEEGFFRVVVDYDLPELTLPDNLNEIAAPDSDTGSTSSLIEGRRDIESISSSLEGRNSPQIGDSSSLVVRDSVPRR